MADRTPQQLRDAARTSRIAAWVAFAVAVLVVAITVARGKPVLSNVPTALALCVAGGSLLVASKGYDRRATAAASPAEPDASDEPPA